MRTVICWIRGHDWERVAITGAPYSLPDVGPGFPMRPDPDGPHRGCRRCRRVEFNPGGTE